MSQNETNDLRNANSKKMAELMQDLLELDDSPDADPLFSTDKQNPQPGANADEDPEDHKRPTNPMVSRTSDGV